VRTHRSSVGESEGLPGTGALSSGSHPRGVLRLPEPGETIAAKYELTRVLGSGAMGVVYEAIHSRLHHRLAVKFLPPDQRDFEVVLERFEREAHTSARLRSVHAARVIDVDSLPNGLPYIVMEYLEGRSLEAELAATGPMPIDVAVDLVLQVTQAMTEAHSLRIIHRDLKPANLFVCRVSGRAVVKVLDFGISRIENDGARITGAGEWFGTPSYAAPEQMQAAANGDARSDIWSLGAIFFELLTGRPPFLGTAVQVIGQALTSAVPWPPSLRSDIPAAVARIIMKALERDPEKRIQSMRELADELERRIG